MNYVKKMCILRQVKQGFSGDGKALSGLIKIEQYGKNLAVEVSIINFAPLVLGEYYCLLSDGKGKTEMLALRGKSLFNLLSDLDISGGFCGIICYVKEEIIPIAYGINGKGSYDWRSILNATLPPVFPKYSHENALTDANANTVSDEKEQKEDTMSVLNEEKHEIDDVFSLYNDDTLANENYYEKELSNEQIQPNQTLENARVESAVKEQSEKTQTHVATNGDADSLLHPFKKDPDGYYLSIKGELDELFNTYPRDESLNGAFSCSEWVRLKGTAKDPQYLVGVLYQDGRAKYVCYALKAEDKNNPPDEIKKVCTFVPCSLFQEEKGFFVLFQSTATGECIKPERA